MSTELRLSGRGAVVTGASGGIGAAVARAFAEEGADVLVHYFRAAAEAEEVSRGVRALGREALVVQADLSKEAGARAIAQAARERFGHIDIWVNMAGYDILTGDGPRLSDREKLDRLTAIDLRGTMLCSWAAAEAMQDQERGVIINTSWNQALAGSGAGSSGREAELYAAVKAGVTGFSKALARTLAPRIRVNVLAPGWIRTEFYETLGQEARRRIAEGTALRRWGRPDDVARAAVFLASTDSDYMTGQVLSVGGGEVM